ncbi:TPA: hypothetical protein ACH3X1_001358 [Trebouxia sp. C0004]
MSGSEGAQRAPDPVRGKRGRGRKAAEALSQPLQPPRRKRLSTAMLRSSLRLLGAMCSWATVRMTGTPYRP